MNMREWLRGRRVRGAALPLLAVVLVGLVAYDAWSLRRASRFNAAITSIEAIDANPTGTLQALHAEPAAVSHEGPAPVLFAQAYRAAAGGRTQDALALYTAAAADARVAPLALYNSGNLHLREALLLAEKNALAQSPQPIELAKRQFREALRADPGYWPAKYNLERALRLSPEIEDDAPLPPPHQSERALTTMRGFTLGLP